MAIDRVGIRAQNDPKTPPSLVGNYMTGVNSSPSVAIGTVWYDIVKTNAMKSQSTNRWYKGLRIKAGRSGRDEEV